MTYYKGFNNDMTCRGFQYEEGREYHEKSAEICKKGFHACEYPLDCFEYYAPSESVYREVELGEDAHGDGADTKKCSTTIKIGAKLDVAGIVEAAVEYTRKRCTNDETGGNQSALAGGYCSALTGGNRSALAGGYCSALTGGDWSALTGGDCSALAGGDRSALTGGDRSALAGGYRSALAGGDCSALAGGDCSALAGGYRSALAGGDCSALTGGYCSALTGGYRSALAGGNRSALAGGYCSALRGGAECKYKGGKWSVFAAEIWNNGKLTDVKTAVVDGKNIKPDTWYQFDGKEFAEIID